MQILSIDAVMSAMADYVSAVADEREALKNLDGYSQRWFNLSYTEPVNENRERAAKLLEEYIEACVIAAIKKNNAQISE